MRLSNSIERQATTVADFDFKVRFNKFKTFWGTFLFRLEALSQWSANQNLSEKENRQIKSKQFTISNLKTVLEQHPF